MNYLLFASKWTPVWRGLKSLSNRADEVGSTDFFHSFRPGYMISVTLRQYPEYATAFWILFASIVAIAIIYYFLKKKVVKLKRRLFFALCAVGAFVCVYLYGEDQTIKSNPLLKMARLSETSVKIYYLFCGDTYGTYDTSTDTLTICSTAHSGDQILSSRESTIRHEVWHIVQACEYAFQNNKWGGITPVKNLFLDTQTLPNDVRQLLNNYPPSDSKIEEEAFKAETFLSDYLIAEVFSDKCLSR